MRLQLRPARVLSVLMLIAVVHVYVFANGITSSNSGTLLGRLITTSNRPIMVNGGEAVTGSTILSGAQLVTAAGSSATVQVDKIATVTVAPNSFLTLNFDANSVTVRLVGGDVSIAAAPGVKSAVLDAAGSPVLPKSAAVPSSISRAEGLGIAGVAIGSAALIWAIIAHNRANDARDSANAANAAAASLAAQLAALRTCLAGQTTSPIKLCTSF
jgi:hypothetical protein